MDSPLAIATSDLLLQGAALMLIGMGTVFLFLTLLVFATLAMSRIVGRLEGDRQPASAEEIAAITAALELHRGRTA